MYERCLLLLLYIFHYLFIIVVTERYPGSEDWRHCFREHYFPPPLPLYKYTVGGKECA